MKKRIMFPLVLIAGGSLKVGIIYQSLSAFVGTLILSSVVLSLILAECKSQKRRRTSGRVRVYETAVE